MFFLDWDYFFSESDVISILSWKAGNKMINVSLGYNTKQNLSYLSEFLQPRPNFALPINFPVILAYRSDCSANFFFLNRNFIKRENVYNWCIFGPHSPILNFISSVEIYIIQQVGYWGERYCRSTTSSVVHRCSPRLFFYFRAGSRLPRLIKAVMCTVS